MPRDCKLFYVIELCSLNHRISYPVGGCETLLLGVVFRGGMKPNRRPHRPICGGVVGVCLMIRGPLWADMAVMLVVVGWLIVVPQ